MTQTLTRLPERMTRYGTLLPYERIIDTHAIVVGVGAIGFQIARSLAIMGVGKISLIDHDKVEPLNLGTQGWDHAHLGQAKVTAAEAALKSIHPDLVVQTWDRKADRELVEQLTSEENAILFLCVDSMAARKDIASWCVCPFIDSRMSAYTIHTLYCDNTIEDLNEAYLDSLFDDSEAHDGPCTARGTYFTANIAAGLSITTWAQSLSGHIPLPQSLLFLDQMVLQGGVEPRPATSPEPEPDEGSPPAATGSDSASPQD